MSGFNMLRYFNGLVWLNSPTTPVNLVQRDYSSKMILKKLGLPDKPKRPPTAFILFKNTIAPELQKEADFKSEVAKAAGARWKSLSESERQIFQVQYIQNLQKYKVKLQKYNELLSEEQVEKLKEATNDLKIRKEKLNMKVKIAERNEQLNKPRKPVPLFFKFMIDQKKNPNESHKEFISRISTLWRKLPEAKKEEYKKNYVEEYQEFLTELDQWEDDMINLGNIEVVRAKKLKEKLGTD